MAAVRDPRHIDAVAALIDFMSAVRRSRMLDRQGTPTDSILIHLAKGGPARSTEIAGALNLDASTVSRHLTRLADDGLIERRPDPEDGRASLVSTTAAGRSRAESSIVDRVAQLESTIENWSDLDLATLCRLLGEVGEALAPSSTLVDDTLVSSGGAR